MAVTPASPSPATTPPTADGAGPGPGGPAMIDTAGLTKVYPGSTQAAVDRLDLSVPAGEIFGLLGPNGAGKTTTTGMLTTRVIPTSGQATLGGVDVVAHPALARQLLGVVSQQNTLDRSLNVWENLYFHGRLFGMPGREAKEEADRLLDRIHLSRWAKASVYALSGGMAQRLMIARSILHRPAVLFLDEPTAGLDPQSRLALWEILGDLNQGGQTILLTTHHMEEADELCRRVAIMDHGRILALGTPDELKRSVDADTVVAVKMAGDDDTLQALGALLEERIPGASGTRVHDDTLELHVRAGARVLAEVVAVAESAHVELVDLSMREPTLETVFIELTGRDLRET